MSYPVYKIAFKSLLKNLFRLGNYRHLPHLSKWISLSFKFHKSYMVLAFENDPKKRLLLKKECDRAMIEAAQFGVAECQFEYGRRLARGEFYAKNCKVDWIEVTKWFERAIEQRHFEGVFWLATMYLEGRKDVPKDIQRGLDTYLNAAIRRDPQSCYSLSDIYERGKYVEKDLIETFKWQWLGVSVDKRCEFENRWDLTEKEVDEAIKRARAFKKEHWCFWTRLMNAKV